MVCILSPAPITQSISRSSSLKGTRSTRRPVRAPTGRFEDAFTTPEVIRQHKESSISPERTPEPREERIIEAVKELYSCSASKTSYNVYAQDVTLRDHSGAMSVIGRDALHDHFGGLQKKYPSANIVKFDASSGLSPSSKSIVVHVEIEYRRNLNSPNPSKITKGVVVLQLSESQEHIVRQTETWEHASQTLVEDSFPSYTRRRTSVTHDDAIYA